MGRLGPALVVLRQSSSTTVLLLLRCCRRVCRGCSHAFLLLFAHNPDEALNLDPVGGGQGRDIAFALPIMFRSAGCLIRR